MILESELFVISIFRGEKDFSKKRNEKAHKRIDRTKAVKTEMVWLYTWNFVKKNSFYGNWFVDKMK